MNVTDLKTQMHMQEWTKLIEVRRDSGLSINADGAGQLIINKETLLKAYNEGGSDLKGHHVANGELTSAVILGDGEGGKPIAANGLTINLTVESGKLVLGNTFMTDELFKVIKASDDADKERPYYAITVLSSGTEKTKIAKIQFYANGVTRLVTP